MLMRLLKADLARGAVVAATLTALIALAATLMSAGTSLIVDSLSATSRLSTQAKLPDLVQMHTGTVDSETIDQWAATRSDIADHEVIKTLPVPRQELTINGRNQSESYSEPAFVTSPKRLDLLLDDQGNPVDPRPGEVVLPIHYRAINSADVGDTVTVSSAGRTTTLTVVGFARDAQMNAAMIPSKRLVVSPEDFSALEQQITEPEYLIEMSLSDSTPPGGVIDAYKEAGLPSNGINVSASMIQLMNSLNAMLIVAVALVVAVVLAVVAVLALRYTVLAAIEMDLAQIAVLNRRAGYAASTCSSTWRCQRWAPSWATRRDSRWQRRWRPRRRSTWAHRPPPSGAWDCPSSQSWCWPRPSSPPRGPPCGASGASRRSRPCAAGPAGLCARAAGGGG